MKKYIFAACAILAFSAWACDDDSSKDENNDQQQEENKDDGQKEDQDGQTKPDDQEQKPGGDSTDNAEPDADGDTISDYYEFYETYHGRRDDYDSNLDGVPDPYVDTDGDTTPDYLDVDSDGDMIPDSIEAGNKGVVTTSPVSSLMGDYCFRSEDCDDNGIPDSQECIFGKDVSTYSELTTTCEDTDGDGIYDYMTLDDDDDGVSDEDEVVGISFGAVSMMDCDGDGQPDPFGSRDNPVDCDNDTIPDFHDFDSDGDGISDFFEGSVDTNGDGFLDRYSQDSDGDGVPDSVEKGSGESPIDTDSDGYCDYVDLDSDGDGVPDKDEVICDNLDNKDSRIYVDTDNDGVDDLAEYVIAVANGVAPKDLICDNTKTAKDYVDFYFNLPLNSDEAKTDTLSFKPLITKADVYLNIDHTGSMKTMIEKLKENFSGVIAPAVLANVPDAAFGISQFGDTNATPIWEQLQAVTTNITEFMNSLNKVYYKSEKTDAAEAGYESLYRIASEVKFRQASLPIIVHITDAESKIVSHSKEEVVHKLNSIGARVMQTANTHYSDSSTNKTQLIQDGVDLAKATNARVPVCAFKTGADSWLCGENKCCTTYKLHDGNSSAQGGDPDTDGYCDVAFENKELSRVYQGVNVLAWQIKAGVEALVKYSTYTVSTRVIGQPIPAADAASEGVDTSCFIQKIEAQSYMPPSKEPEQSCAQSVGTVSFDYSGRGYNDAFKNFAVGAATPDSPTSTLTFNVVAQNKNCVVGSTTARSFNATIEVYDPITGLIFDKQSVAIVVPAEEIHQIM